METIEIGDTNQVNSKSFKKSYELIHLTTQNSVYCIQAINHGDFTFALCLQLIIFPRHNPTVNKCTVISLQKQMMIMQKQRKITFALPYALYQHTIYNIQHIMFLL